MNHWCWKAFNKQKSTKNSNFNCKKICLQNNIESKSKEIQFYIIWIFHTCKRQKKEQKNFFCLKKNFQDSIISSNIKERLRTNKCTSLQCLVREIQFSTAGRDYWMIFSCFVLKTSVLITSACLLCSFLQLILCVYLLDFFTFSSIFVPFVVQGLKELRVVFKLRSNSKQKASPRILNVEWHKVYSKITIP